MKITRNLVEKTRDIAASLFLLGFLGFTLIDTFSKGERLVVDRLYHSTVNGRVSDNLIFTDGTVYDSLCPGEKSPNHPHHGQIYRRSPYLRVIHPWGK